MERCLVVYSRKASLGHVRLGLVVGLGDVRHLCVCGCGCLGTQGNSANGPDRQGAGCSTKTCSIATLLFRCPCSSTTWLLSAVSCHRYPIPDAGGPCCFWKGAGPRSLLLLLLGRHSTPLTEVKGRGFILDIVILLLLLCIEFNRLATTRRCDVVQHTIERERIVHDGAPSNCAM
jgi:hypothetical protein